MPGQMPLRSDRWSLVLIVLYGTLVSLNGALLGRCPACWGKKEGRKEGGGKASAAANDPPNVLSALRNREMNVAYFAHKKTEPRAGGE